MADPVSLCASIIGIAGAGYQLAATLETIFRADDSLKHAAQDISLTSSVLQELGKLIEADVSGTNRICSANATKTAEEAMRSCKSIFDEFQAALQSSLRKRTHSSSDDKRTLSALGKLKWPVTSRKMDYLRSNLDKLKSTLNLLLGVLSYAKHLSTEEHANAQVAELMRGGIERLIQLDAESAERHKTLQEMFETRGPDALSTLNKLADSYITPSAAQQRFATDHTLLASNSRPAASEMTVGSQVEARAAHYPISRKESSSIHSIPPLLTPPPKRRSYNLTWADMSRCQSVVLHLLSYINGIMQQFEKGNDLRASDLKICAVYDDVKKVLDEHISMGALRLANSFHTSPYDTSPQPEIFQLLKKSATTVLAAHIEDPRQRNLAIELGSVPLTQLENEEGRSRLGKQAELNNAANLSGVYEHAEDLERYEVSQEHYQLPIGRDRPATEMAGQDDDERTFHDSLGAVGLDDDMETIEDLCDDTASYSDISSNSGGRLAGAGGWIQFDQTYSSMAGPPQTALYTSISDQSTDSEGPETRRKVTKYAMINRPRAASNIEQGKQEDFVNHTHANEEMQKESLGSVHGTAADYYHFLALPDRCASSSRRQSGSRWAQRSQPDPTVTQNVPAEFNPRRHRSTVGDGKIKRRGGRVPLVQQMPQQMPQSTETQSPSTDTQTMPNNPGLNTELPNIPTTMSTSADGANGSVTPRSSVQIPLGLETLTGRNMQASRFRTALGGVADNEEPLSAAEGNPVKYDPVNELVMKWTLLDVQKLSCPRESMSFGQEKSLLM